MSDTNMRYFIFSETQYEEKTNRAARINKKYYPGSVLVNGNWKEYTDYISSMDDLKYSDSIIVTAGEADDIKFKKSKIL